MVIIIIISSIKISKLQPGNLLPPTPTLLLPLRKPLHSRRLTDPNNKPPNSIHLFETSPIINRSPKMPLELRINILRHQSSNKHKRALRRRQHRRIRKHIPIHQPRRQSQVFRPASIHLAHYPFADFPVHGVEKPLPSMEDGGGRDGVEFAGAVTR